MPWAKGSTRPSLRQTAVGPAVSIQRTVTHPCLPCGIACLRGPQAAETAGTGRAVARSHGSCTRNPAASQHRSAPSPDGVPGSVLSVWPFQLIMASPVGECYGTWIIAPPLFRRSRSITMPAPVTCPSCKRTMKAPDAWVNMPVKCPACAHEFVAVADVPAATPPSPAPEPAPAVTAPATPVPSMTVQPVADVRPQTALRTIVMLVALLGILPVGWLGMKWLQDYRSVAGQ